MSSAVVLVDAEIRPWQAAIIDALAAAGLRLHVSAPSGPRARGSAAVRLYGRFDRWPSSRGSAHADEGDAGDAELVVDLTTAVSSASASSSIRVLSFHPRDLDEEAVLSALATRRQTFPLEVRLRVAGGERRVAASTVALSRFSARRSAQRVRERAAALIVRALSQVDAADRLPLVGAAAEQAPPRATAPAVAKLFVEAALSRAALALTRVDWRVAYGAAVPGEPFAVPRELTSVSAPPGRFYADPFLAEQDGATFLFVEDFDLALGRAAISVIQLSTGETRRALTANHHLSYPHVFEQEGTWFMLPEQAETRQVVLLRCLSFPDRWVDDTVLVDGVRAYDPTLLHHDGLWWLFFAAGTDSSPDDELHVWFSSALRGPYAPHPANPVASNAVGSRPAGRIVHVDGRILRPAQDGSGEYGRAVVVQEIVELTPTEYEERPIATLSAEELGAEGIHTINTGGGVVVIDTKHRVLRRPGRAR
jgi:hypothetical protein